MFNFFDCLTCVLSVLLNTFVKDKGYCRIVAFSPFEIVFVVNIILQWKEIDK